MQPTITAPELDHSFTVGVDAIMVGDDGRDGLLAASLRYVSRLAKAFSHVLDLGELAHLETTGSRTVIVEVAWDLAGDSRLRGQVIRSRRPTATTTHTSAGTVDDVVAGCLSALESCDSVRWAALFRRDLPSLHTSNIPAGATLGQIGLRALGILGGIEAELRETCVWLGYERGTVVLAPVGPHCLVLSVDTDELDAGALLSRVVEAQARLAPHDLATASATARPRLRSTDSVTVGPPRLVGARGAGDVPGALPVGQFGSALDAATGAVPNGSHKLRRPQLSLPLHR